VTSDERAPLREAELDAIAQLRGRIGGPRAGEVWIGDDMAVLSGPTTLLFATDVAVEGVHFTTGTGSLADAGWKALAANLSDVAAMGGMPTAAVVGLAGAARAELDSLYDGILACAAAFDCPVVGGDLTSAPVIVISIAVVGDAGEEPPVLRSAGLPGDQVFVTRPTGASAAGLRALTSDARAVGDVVDAHRRPVPRLAEGRAAKRAGATAMIDVSDGLGLDLDRLCRASGVGVVLDRVPIAPGATLEDAMSGGEDYELVFTAADAELVAAGFRADGLLAPIVIGRLVEDVETRKIGDEDFVPRGYLHDLA
jgi:thiamine-monophosphate kinase